MAAAACGHTGTVSVWAIVVAAGSGTRFGGAKQFVRLGGLPSVDRAAAAAGEVCDGVVVVVPAGHGWRPPSGVVSVAGGATRSESVRAGLAAVPEDAEIVVVHDAARPLASIALFSAVIAEVRRGADAAVPALAVVDTVKRVEAGRVIETVERDGLYTVQTPQAFRAGALRKAHAGGAHGTDDAALVEAMGGTVLVVEGDARNVKVTVAADVEMLDALLGER